MVETRQPSSELANGVLGAARLRPRPLYDGELPAPGDLHFAVGFGKGGAIVSKIIAAGTASRTNHVGVITAADATEWVMVEALARGVQVETHRPPPVSTVIRLSDDADVRDRVAHVALERQAAKHIRYDWATIARIVFVGMFGRVPFLVIPLLVMPAFARYVDPVWLGPLVALALMAVLYRARRLLFRLAMAVPWPDSPNRMICSEFARRVLEEAFGADALPGLRHVSCSMTSPGDLLQALLQRAHYGAPGGHRVKDAVTDGYLSATSA